MSLSIKKKAIKKAVSVVTMVATIVCMSGVASFSLTSLALADVVDGSLIKSNATNPDGTPTLASLDVYIVKLVGTKKFKRLILNPTVFDSYGHLNWGDIQTVSQAVMDEYTTSSLVRVDTDPDEKVYAMAPDGDIGSKSWINLTTAEATSISSYDADGVYTINSVDGGNYTSVGDITTVTALETFYSAGTLPAAPTAGTGLTVALASDTPSSTTIVTGGNTLGAQALIPMLNLNFTAASDGDAKVNEMKLAKVGLLSDTYILNAYLYDGGTRLAQMYSVVSGVLTFSDSNGLFTVPAGTTKTITVKMDMEDSASAGSTVGFSLNSAADITTDGAVVSGSFPATGNQMSVASISDLGILTVGATVTAGSGTIDPQDNYELFKASFASTNQDLEISYLKFSNVGTVSAGDIQNLKVMVNGVQHGDTVDQEDDNNTVSFDLSSDPIVLTSGQTKDVKLFGDIIAGSSRTYRWSFQDASDIIVVDKMYNVNLFPLPSGGTAGVWTIVQAAAADTIASGTMTVSKASDAPTGNIADGATNVPISKWSLKASGEAIKVNTLSYEINFQESGGTANTSLILKNLKFYKVVDGVETAIGTAVTSVTDSNEDADSWETAASMSLGTTLTVQAGQTVYILVKADLTDTTIENGDIIAIKLNGTGSLANAQALVSKSSVEVPGSDVESNDLTVASGSLSSAENTAFADPTLVTGATSQKVGSWVITAGAAEGVNITQIVIKDNDGTLNGTATTYAFGDTFANAQLWNSSKTIQYGSTMSSPSGTIGAANTFSINNLSLNAGESKVINLYADVLSGGAWTTGDGLEIDSITATGATTSTSVSDSTGGVGQGITLAAAGQLTVAAASAPTNPNSKILVGSSTDNVVGAWKFSANTSEDLIVSQVIVYETGSYPGNTPTLSLYVDGALAGGPVPLVDGASDTATFTGMTITIPAGGYKNLVLKADVNDSTNATEGQTSTFRVSTPAAITGASSNTIIARGATSGTYATLASASTNYDGNAHTVYDTVVTVDTVHTGVTATAGAAKEIMTFKVTADNKDAYVRDMYIQKAGTATPTGTSSLAVYDAADMTTALYTLQNVTPVAGNVTIASNVATFAVAQPTMAVGNIFGTAGGQNLVVTTVTSTTVFTVAEIDGTAAVDEAAAAGEAGDLAIAAQAVINVPFEDSAAVTVAAGTTKNFVVKADTTHSVAANGDSLQYSIPNTSTYYFGWRDSSVSSNINNTLITSFPVTGGVLSYQ